ncbi:pantothenate synthetase [Longispora fulva]|uniref:Pantothenate synthetase n=1 Tax=Longispora fulva TaxID=619741 RepID=A0A8J7GVB0_9ACTN|nr:pantoate--beta-alanine ligase [Longispora fulva]MBG6139214.1 pantoate--beta-alanine ligase [Longispora fulva]GIG58708.1 pantothenate synthetase [Longispora fulva]
MTLVVADRARLASARQSLTGRMAVVMTMGALHPGHAALLQQARAEADHVIATIFVNPLQFGPSEDLDRYPRTLDADLDICRAAGVDAVFTPTVDVIYPVTPSVRIDPGPTGGILDGASRPGHFAGMLTVVHKLLRLTAADVAYFGEKDYQQLTLIRQMVRDLDMGTEIVGVPTVREPDGLALSSRNRFLSPAERERALALSRALHACPGGTAEEILAAAGNELKGVDLDYLALTDPLLGPVVPGPARLLVAARVGTTRLIDNAPVEVH